MARPKKDGSAPKRGRKGKEVIEEPVGDVEAAEQIEEIFCDGEDDLGKKLVREMIKQYAVLLNSHRMKIMASYREALDSHDNDLKFKYPIPISASITGADPNNYKVETEFALKVRKVYGVSGVVRTGHDMVDMMEKAAQKHEMPEDPPPGLFEGMDEPEAGAGDAAPQEEASEGLQDTPGFTSDEIIDGSIDRALHMATGANKAIAKLKRTGASDGAILILIQECLGERGTAEGPAKTVVNYKGGREPSIIVGGDRTGKGGRALKGKELVARVRSIYSFEQA